MSYHKILDKQITKYLSDEYVKDENVRLFLSAVSNYYNTIEKDKKLSEHAFTISEKEYQEATKNLREQNDIRHRSILKLKEAIRSLDDTAIVGLDDSDDDLINIIGFLQKQIIKTKQLETDLIGAKEIAEKAAKAKSDFLSVMSHEIRTPLNAIIGYIHLLITEDPKPTQMEFLHILQISADNLLSIINDVLDFSKIEVGKVEFAERDIDVRQIVNNIKQAYRIKAEEKGNTIKVMFDEDIPSYVKGDDMRLTQILNNLISNAIKFTSKGKVTVEVLLKERTLTDFEISFAVIDTGIGIAKDKHEMILERFTQENSNITREYGGSGLGLAIIRKLLQLQHSDIMIDSEPGKGSTFSFSLRFKKSETIHKKEEKYGEQDKSDLQGIKILLVEDVEFNIILANKMLSNWNAVVTVAENGLKAVQAVEAGQFDIILMDLQMPIMDGLTATRKIRTFNPDIPIIALTASTSAEIIESVHTSGMTDFLSKPINPGYLYTTIQKYTVGKE